MPFARVAIFALLALTLGSCVPIGIDREIARFPSLAKAYAHRFPIGAAVEPWQLDTVDGRLLAWHFNSVVAENAMKPPRVQPHEGRFEFADADRIVDFARRHGMKVRGHTLLWHEETPAWFWQGDGTGPASRERVLERLRTHVHAVVGRYRGQVYAWDVVNEPIDASHPDCLRRDRWREVVGPDYLDWAFRFAHEADPSARLFLNDYETTDAARRGCLLRIARGLLERGVPLHGIGHQMHIHLERPSEREVEEVLRETAALGLESQVTELDVSLAETHAPTAEALQRQGARYEALFAAFARAGVTAVTFWGISDAHTWRNTGRPPERPDRPLLFDRERQPKPAYLGVMKAASR
jgi:endo-1,4-beta-xylanase